MSENTQFKPLVQEVEPKTYVWCACGQSKDKVFCDGSHGPTGLTPRVVEITEKKKVAWCTCKATATPPFCDGSHSKVGSSPE